MIPSNLKTLVGKASPKAIATLLGEREGVAVYLIWNLIPRKVCFHDLSTVCLGIESWAQPYIQC